MKPQLKDLDELRTFVQVVDSGGLTAAGRVLGLPTNVVSRRLARLEDRLGVPLAIRTTRHLEPTAEGRRLHQRARSILDEVDEAEAELRGLDADLHGELRLGIPTRLATWIRPALRRFLERYPEVALQLFVTDRPPPLVLGDIASHGLDAAVLVGVVPPGPHIVRRLGQLSLRLAASTKYLTAHGRPRRVADLSRHNCLSFIGLGVQTHWTLVDRRGDEVEVAIRSRFAASDSRALLDALLDGIGVGIIEDGELNRHDALEPVLPSYRMAPLPIGLGYAAPRRRSRRIAALHELLLGHAPLPFTAHEKT
ncbi:MAG: LysR family transcriptional regulator [Myxococcota bacterium]